MHHNKFQGKIIGVGFQKTGTSTLREALRILGFRVKDTTPAALIPILRKDFRRVLRLIRNFDAVEDTPWYMIYRELDKLIPDSRFILTIRDSDSWYRSVSNHIGDLRAAHHEWIYGRGKGLPKDDKDNTIRVYEKHNREVMEYFRDRPADLMVIDFTKGEGWEKLCPFLGLQEPEAMLPHYNKTSYEAKPAGKSFFKTIRRRLKNNFKIWYISLLGLWPEE